MNLGPLKTIKLLFTVLVISFLILGMDPSLALGGPSGGIGYKIEGDSNGLIITTDQDAADMKNLNPGDQKCSRLYLENSGSRNLTVYLRTNIQSERTLGSGYLADVMELTIKDGEKVITDKLFRASANDGNLVIGTMAPGTKKTLNFCVNLPGEKLDNQYQGASMKVNWVLTTVASSSHDDDDDDDNNYEKPTDPIDPTEPTNPGEPVIPEPKPPFEPKVVIDVNEEPVPAGPGMPYTGEASPLYFYGVGALITMMGLAVRRK